MVALRTRRRTLRDRDLLGAMMSSHQYDFLVDITSACLAASQGEDASLLEPVPIVPAGMQCEA